MNEKCEFYRDTSSKWRWKRTASNGAIVGALIKQIVLKMQEETVIKDKYGI